MGSAITRGCAVGISKDVLNNKLRVVRDYISGSRQWMPAIYVLFICK